MDDFEPNEHRPVDYVSLPGTEMLATSCMFCGRALADPDSVTQGCGPDCADKYGVFAEPGATDVVALDHALKTAPATLRDKVAPLVDEKPEAVRRIIHTAGYHWEHRTAEALHVLGSAIELTRALGYQTVADKIQRRYVEGLDHQGGNKGIVVKAAPGGSGWQLRMPYMSNYATWRSIFDAMRQLRATMFKDGKQTVYVFPEARWLEVLNVLARHLPGQIGVLPNGDLFVVPQEPMPLPAPPGRAENGPQVETREKPQPIEFKKGMLVELNDGTEAVVGWIKADGSSIGVMPADSARESLKKFGRITPGRAGYTFLGTDQVRGVRSSQLTIDEVEKTIEAPIVQAPRDLPESMYQYQKETAIWADTVGSGILALDMGLGKSLCSIAVADAPVVIVCPSSLRINWVREVNRWRPDLTVSSVGVELSARGKVRGVSSEISSEALKADVVVVSYDLLIDRDRKKKKKGEAPPISENLQKLLDRGCNTLIADEAHYLKELDLKYDRSERRYLPSATCTARAAAIWNLSLIAKRKLLLTGTPILNYTYEIWALLAIVAPDRFINFWDFAKRYCAAHKTRFGWDYKGNSNTQELHDTINGKYMLRKTKDELDLPEKSRRSIELSMDGDGAKEYQFAASQFLEWVAQNGGPEKVARVRKAEVLTKLTTLRRLAANGKADPLIEQATEFLTSTKRPLIIMGWHTDALHRMQAGLEKAGFRVGTIMGGDSAQARQKAVDGFQIGEPVDAAPEDRKYLDVLVCSIAAAGVGLTLTRASDMFFLERAWRPSDLVQAEDRIYRIGQKNAVTITYYDAPGTIDAYIAKLLMNKVSTAAAVIDGENLSDEQALDRVLGEMFGDFSEMRPNSSAPELGGEDEDYDWMGFE